MPLAAAYTASKQAIEGFTGSLAHALGRNSEAPVPWTTEVLEQYLAEGFHPDHGVAQGPMSPVVEKLAQVPREEVSAMAAYLASLGSATLSPAPPATKPAVLFRWEPCRSASRPRWQARALPTVADEPQIPFGGVKSSGRFGGKTSIREFTDTRWVTIETRTERVALSYY